MKRFWLVISIGFCLGMQILPAQEARQTSDSIRMESVRKKVLGLSTPDSIQEYLAAVQSDFEEKSYYNLLNNVAFELKYKQPYVAKNLSEKVLEQTAEREGFEHQRMKAYANLGIIFDYKLEDYKKASDYLRASLKLAEILNDSAALAAAYNSLGIVNKNRGQFKEAVQCYMSALKYTKEQRTANTYINLGNIFYYTQDFAKAREYYEKGGEIATKYEEKELVALAVGNIAFVLAEQGEIERCFEYFDRSLKIYEELGNKKELARTHSNIGEFYIVIGQYEEAEKQISEAIDLYRELNDREGMAMALTAMADAKLSLENYSEAIDLLHRALEYAREVNAAIRLKYVYAALHNAYFKAGEYKKAYLAYQNYEAYKDSILNEQKSKMIGELEAKYQSEKKDAEIKLLNKTKAINEAKIKEQQLIEIMIAIALLAALVILVVIYKNLQNKRKSNLLLAERNEEISAQRDQIEQQKYKLQAAHDNVRASINYAERIQTALLKNEEHVAKHFPPHFILYIPKDVVSGDFYWIQEKENHLYIAAADCTGHGVPGGFLTMLGTSFLNEIVTSEQLLPPAEILDRLRERFVKELSQTGEEGGSKDGMDISMACIDLKTNRLQWAGANNPLYILRRQEQQIEIIKADKQPIGYFQKAAPFSNHELQLQPGDTFYLFSDGYADQFGGPEGKKFSYRKFRDMLVDINPLPMAEQKQHLRIQFEQWLEEGGENQIDDVCVIGVRLE